MNNYLAINPPKWRDTAVKKPISTPISPNTRQSGEIEKTNPEFTNKRIRKNVIAKIEGVIGGITEGIKKSDCVMKT